MELLLVAAVLSWVVKNGVTDLIYSGASAACAVRGKPSPEWGMRSRGRLDGAASRYFSQLWTDSWGDALAKHNARRERQSPTASSRPRGAARVFFGNAFRDGTRGLRRSWDGAWVRVETRRQEKATRPRPDTTVVPGTVVPNAQDGDRPEPATVPTGDDMPVPSAEDDQDEPTDPNEQDDDQSVPDYVPDFRPDSDPSSPAMPTTEGTTTMTTTTGEVTGLDTAIRFCEDSARGYQAQIHEIELAKASLNTAEATAVAGPLAVAMDMTEAAAKAMKEAEMELRKQIPIAELYRANPGAATKDFMLQG